MRLRRTREIANMRREISLFGLVLYILAPCLCWSQVPPAIMTIDVDGKLYNGPTSYTPTFAQGALPFPAPYSSTTASAFADAKLNLYISGQHFNFGGGGGFPGADISVQYYLKVVGPNQIPAPILWNAGEASAITGGDMSFAFVGVTFSGAETGSAVACSGGAGTGPCPAGAGRSVIVAPTKSPLQTNSLVEMCVHMFGVAEQSGEAFAATFVAPIFRLQPRWAEMHPDYNLVVSQIPNAPTGAPQNDTGAPNTCGFSRAKKK